MCFLQLWLRLPAMALFLATPHQYGAEVCVRDAEDFQKQYGNQAAVTDQFFIVAPSAATLAEWAKSCLKLGPYRDTHPCGGWSPFRSAEVRVHGETEARTLFYKLGDSNCWDFTSRTAPRHYPMLPWYQTLGAFVRAALKEFLAASERDCVLSPCDVMRKMLCREWGSAGDAFTRFFIRARIDPHVLFDDLVREAWSGLIRLPTPSAFNFVTQDSEVQRALVVMVGMRAQHKGLRV